MNPDHAQGEVNTTTRDSNAADVDISYKNNWKYKTCSDHTHCLDASTTKVVAEVLSTLSEQRLETRYYTLTSDCLTVKEDYAWDGASGPTIDTRTSMRASLIHDALYQVCRSYVSDMGSAIWGRLRKVSDCDFRRILKEDGVFFLRGWAWWGAVRRLGCPAARGIPYAFGCPALMSKEERAAVAIWQLIMRRSSLSVKESWAHNGPGEPIPCAANPSSMTIQTRECSGRG